MADLPLRLLAFLTMCIVYALFGSPTPDSLGWDEMVVGLALLIAVKPVSAMHAVVSHHKTPWLIAGQAFLLYGLSVPVITGLSDGHDPVLMIRDVIPFLFLLLPFFMHDWRGSTKIITAGVALIGLVFAARVVAPVVMAHGNFIGVGFDPLYLSIAPTISFAMILCGGLAGLLLYRGWSLKNIGEAGVLSLLAIIPLAAMVITLQRAGIGLSILTLDILFSIAFIRRPKRAVGPLLIMLCLGVVFLPSITEVSDSLLHKNMLVGNNNRFQEASVVFDSVSKSVWSILFGKGWGTTLADPAVGGVTVNYTHNIFTTYLLKTGLCGLMLLVLYLYGVCAPLVKMVRVNPVITLALGVPLMIDLVLYASFKSLDFGLILLLAMLWGRKLHENAA